MYEFPQPEPEQSDVERRLRRGRNLAIGSASAVLLVAIGVLLSGLMNGGSDDVATADEIVEAAAPGDTADVDGGGSGLATTMPPTDDSGAEMSSAGGEAPGSGDGSEEPLQPDDEFELMPGNVGEDAGDPPAPSEPPPPPTPPAPEPLDPVEPAAVTPCDEVLAKGENLLVTPDPLVMPNGSLASELQITNCGDAPVDWSASTKPWVDLASANGSLAGGSTAVLGFSIPSDAVDEGAFDFKIKVSEPGHNTYVDVSGFRQLVGTEFQAPGGGFTAGVGAGGCANQCISSALLTGNATTANVDIEVRTKVPAAIEVYVSTSPPVDDDNGDPHFPGVGMKAFSSGFVSEFNSPLKPLDAATEYYIVVVARDENGKVSHRSGTFMTRTPVELPGNFADTEPGGCRSQCITTARVVAGSDARSRRIEVGTNLPTFITVSLSTSAPPMIDGVPAPSVDDLLGISGGEMTSWSVDADDLDWGTRYWVTVAATDEWNNTRTFVGDFTTAAAPRRDVRVSIHDIRIINDGDRVGRGELQFGFDAPGHELARYEEERLSDGDQALFWWTAPSFLFEGVEDFVPQIRVIANERDIATFAVPFPIDAIDAGRNDDQAWNLLTTGFVSLESLDSLPSCSEFGFGGLAAGNACFETSTDPDIAKEFPSFRMVVMISVSG